MRRLKSFVRYDGTGRAVAGSNILIQNKPKVGKWVEIENEQECCNSTSTTTSSSTSTSTTTTNLITTTSTSTTQNNEYPVFIISGQSNAIGSTNESAGAYAGPQIGSFIWSNSPDTDPDVYQFKTYEAGVTSKLRDNPTGYGWSVEAVSSKDLRTYFGKDVYIIKSGAGGQPISMWTPGQAMWNDLFTKINDATAAIQALGRIPKFVGFLWLQGEAEIVAGNNLNTYKTLLSNFINNIRGISAEMANIMFISYKLSVDYQTSVNPPPPSFTPTRAAFNVAMQEVIDTKTRAVAIDVDCLSNIGTVDGIHYNNTALISMGVAGYNKIIQNL